MDCTRIISLYKRICVNDASKKSAINAVPSISCHENGGGDKDCQYLRRLNNDCETEEAYTAILFPKKPRVIIKHGYEGHPPTLPPTRREGGREGAPTCPPNNTG
jgi:hypothetical protein